MNDPILSISELERYFYQGDKKINILINAELNLYPGKLTALIGPSGAGKTTLLNIAGLLEKPNSGNVKICNQDTFKLSQSISKNDATTRPTLTYIRCFRLIHLFSLFSFASIFGFKQDYMCFVT